MNSSTSGWLVLTRNFVAGSHPQNDSVAASHLYHVSREHLPKYANEFAFRWNHRKITDGERMHKAVMATNGKRLSYKPLTSLKAKQAIAPRKQEKEAPKRIFRGPPQS